MTNTHQMMINTYQGMTFDEIDNHYGYSPKTGVVFSKITGMPVGNSKGQTVRRVGGEPKTLRISVLATILKLGRCLKPSERITYVDRRISNLKSDNLVVVDKNLSDGSCNPATTTYIATEKDGVLYGPHNKLYVVQRGPDDAVYRTSSKLEAYSIRNLYELGQKTPSFDKITTKIIEKALKSNKSTTYPLTK